MRRIQKTRIQFGVPYMAKHGRWRLSIVYAEAPMYVGALRVRRWSTNGQKWSKPRPLAGGIVRLATDLDCSVRGLPAPSDPFWRKLSKSLAKVNGAEYVVVPWEMAVSFNVIG